MSGSETRATSPLHERDLEARARALLEKVRAQGYAARGAVEEGLSDDEREALHRVMREGGVEVGTRHFRTPLYEQLRALVPHGPASLSTVRKGVRGVDGPGEWQDALEALMATGEVHTVSREEGLCLAFCHEDEVLSPEAVEALRDHCESLLGFLRKVTRRKEPAYVLREDLLPAAQLIGEAATLREVREPEGDLDVTTLMDFCRSRHASGQRLIFVPDVAKAMAPANAQAVQNVLLEADEAGLIELRPESGVGLLADDDARLCPTTSDGVPLSYLRVCGGER